METKDKDSTVNTQSQIEASKGEEDTQNTNKAEETSQNPADQTQKVINQSDEQEDSKQTTSEEKQQLLATSQKIQQKQDKPVTFEKEEEKKVENTQEIKEFGHKVYCWGSCESDQFLIGGDKYETKKPVEIPFFRENKIIVCKLECGSMHSLALDQNGFLYSWGCNDDRALGRDSELEGGPNQNEPFKVELPCSVDLISAGDSHSIAVNSDNAVIFQWGTYRNLFKGNMKQTTKSPERIGQDDFKGKLITKVLSGQNHAIILASESVYVWGDPDTFVLARKPVERRKFDQALKIEGIGQHKVLDVYTGGNHAFLKKKDKKNNDYIYLGWGMGLLGQLGVGNNEDSYAPQEITFLRGKNIQKICGGEHHTVALDDTGKVYAWGKNDSGQLGVEDDCIEFNKEDKPNSKVPVHVDSIEDIIDIFSAAQHNYAKRFDKETNAYEIHSWGFGMNYVLGNGKEDDVYDPFRIHPSKFFKDEKISLFSMGTQHSAFTVIEDYDNPPVINKSNIENIDPSLKTKTKSRAGTSKKKPVEKQDEEIESASNKKRGKSKSKTVSKIKRKLSDVDEVKGSLRKLKVD